ncbi:MAG: hypothetical protein ACF8TS_16145 [Maioricimonas sp. JB049]
MSDSTSPTDAPETAAASSVERAGQQTARAIGLWLLLGGIGVFVLSIAAGFAPAPVKRLLLFYLAFGLIAGGGLGRLAYEVGVRPSVLIVILGNLLLLAGGLNVTRVSYDRFHAHIEEQVRRDDDTMLGLRLLERTAGDDPELQARAAAERARLDPRFRDYLRHRVSPLGTWAAPWPLVFWIAELVLALAAGTWGMLRTMRQPASS